MDGPICNITFSTLTLRQMFKMTFKVRLQLIQRVLTRQTRCCQKKCRAFTESKIITVFFLQKRLLLKCLLSEGQNH